MSIHALCRTHRISFELGTTVKDLAGGTTRENWTPVPGLTSLLCTIQNASHRERFLWGQRQLWLTNIIYIPRVYVDSIQSRYRIKELADNRIFKILSYADEAGRDALTKIYAQEMLK
jgi:hypothetical protein